jgi:predicted enzyme related to lactoylglutathione lyase
LAALCSSLDGRLIEKGVKEMANPFVHVELLTDDLAQSKKFYNSLFDCKLEDVPGMDYTMVGVGEGTGGGMMKNPVPGLPSHWMAYVLVEDVNASTKKAMSLGAKVVKEVTEVPGYGWFSVITDPTGAALGLWQTKEGM